jgi:hypothetical protein
MEGLIDFRMMLGKWWGNIPSVKPDNLCDNFKAGNLKNMKMYIEPSKMLAVTPRARSRLSGFSQFPALHFDVKLTLNEQTQCTLGSCAIPLSVQNRSLLCFVAKILRLPRHQKNCT